MDETGGVSINELLCGCCCFIVFILGAAQEMSRGKFNLYTVGGVSGRYVFSITLPFSSSIHPSIHPSNHPSIHPATREILLFASLTISSSSVCMYVHRQSQQSINFIFLHSTRIEMIWWWWSSSESDLRLHLSRWWWWGDVYEMICSTAITYAKMADTLTHL